MKNYTVDGQGIPVPNAVHSSARTGTGKDDWTTPGWLFRRLNSEFGFDLDAAATAENKLCPRYMGPDHPDVACKDALTATWEGSVWVNPPYSKLPHFLLKARLEAMHLDRVQWVAMLVPARTDTKVWHDEVMAHAREVRFIRGRLKFGAEVNPAPFPSAIIVFGGIRPWNAPHFSSLSGSPVRKDSTR